MATKAKTAPAQPAASNDNLRLWNVLGKTDPRHTKPITGRGFDGTAVKPMWQNKRLTETFGPCGVGWGFEKPEFETVRGAGADILVFCTVSGWYVPDPEAPDEIAHVYGVGGDKVVTTQNNGKIRYDDEAFKKAFTDAIGNAFKFIGVAADVHMGLFDDSKYVQDLRAEFETADDHLGIRADALLEKIRTCDNLETLVKELKPEVVQTIHEFTQEKRDGEAAMMSSTYNARSAKLKQALPKKDPAKEPAPKAETKEAAGAAS